MSNPPNYHAGENIRSFKIEDSSFQSEGWPQRMRMLPVGLGDSFARLGAWMALFNAIPAINKSPGYCWSSVRDFAGARQSSSCPNIYLASTSIMHPWGSS
jgi:hypothetical protein